MLRAHQQAKVDKRKGKNPNAVLLMDDDDDDDDDDSGETQEAQERRILMAYLKEQETHEQEAERRAEEMRTGEMRAEDRSRIVVIWEGAGWG